MFNLISEKKYKALSEELRIAKEFLAHVQTEKNILKNDLEDYRRDNEACSNDYSALLSQCESLRSKLTKAEDTIRRLVDLYNKKR